MQRLRSLTNNYLYDEKSFIPMNKKVYPNNMKVDPCFRK